MFWGKKKEKREIEDPAIKGSRLSGKNNKNRQRSDKEGMLSWLFKKGPDSEFVYFED